jgi:beta-lactamase class D/beta-lactamase class D OXA-42
MKQWIAAAALLSIASVSATSHASTILCTIIADGASGKVLKRHGTCGQRITAASTFKIAMSLMGYDAGYLTDEHLPALPFRAGYPDWVPSWRATTDPSRWISESVVWYSQRLTEWLGPQRLQHYVTAFNYGNEDLSGDPGKNNGLTHAWLSSSLKISALEELAFLEKIVRRQLPVTARAYEMTARITALPSTANGWEVHGKTGTGSPKKADGSEDDAHAFGWFVGWATKGGRTIVFVRSIQDTPADAHQELRAGLRARAGFLRELPGLLDSL